MERLLPSSDWRHMHRNGILKRICLALFIFQYDLFLICLFVYFFFHFSLYIVTPLFLRYDSQRVDHQIIVNSFSMIFAWALSCHHLYLSTHKHNFVDTRYFLCTRALFSRVLFWLVCIAVFDSCSIIWTCVLFSTLL